MPKKNVKLTIKYMPDSGEMFFRWLCDKVLERRKAKFKEKYGIDFDKPFVEQFDDVSSPVSIENDIMPLEVFFDEQNDFTMHNEPHQRGYKGLNQL